MKNFQFILVAAAFLFGNIHRFSFFSQEVNISLLDIAIFILIVINFKRIFGIYHPLKLPTFIFSLVSLLALIISGTKYDPPAFVIGLMYWLRWTVYSFSFLTLSFPSWQIIFLGLGATAVGLTQYLVVPDIRHMEHFGWDPHYYRVIGSFLDPGFLGVILVFTLIFLSLDPPKSPLLNFSLWSAVYIALALTYSRSGYLAFLAAMGYISFRQKAPHLAVMSLLLLSLTILALPRPGGEGVRLERTSTIEARIINWKNSLTVFRDNPLIGVGFNTYRYAQKEYGLIEGPNWLKNHAGAGADSSLLFVLSTTGIIGFIAYVLYLRALSKQGQTAYFLVPLLVHSLFLNSLFYPAVMLWLSLIVSKGYKSL